MGGGETTSRSIMFHRFHSSSSTVQKVHKAQQKEGTKRQ